MTFFCRFSLLLDDDDGDQLFSHNEVSNMNVTSLSYEKWICNNDEVYVEVLFSHC